METYMRKSKPSGAIVTSPLARVERTRRFKEATPCNLTASPLSVTCFRQSFAVAVPRLDGSSQNPVSFFHRHGEEAKTNDPSHPRRRWAEESEEEEEEDAEGEKEEEEEEEEEEEGDPSLNRSAGDRARRGGRPPQPCPRLSHRYICRHQPRPPQHLRPRLWLGGDVAADEGTSCQLASFGPSGTQGPVTERTGRKIFVSDIGDHVWGDRGAFGGGLRQDHGQHSSTRQSVGWKAALEEEEPPE
ncbi:hypothetical protein BHE74_00036793 [Ensete ventricosum]|nr:hypothetical protein GW17_00018179 [Ensete ventricosum]RWW56483.1 hypothetical protein BHE74_00036793 [Ensete ventricosum]